MGLKKAKLSSKIEYILLLFMILMSGGALYENHYQIKMVLLFICASVFSLIKLLNKSIELKKLQRNIMVILLLFVFVLVVPIINGINSFSTYFGILLHLLIGMFMCMSISRKELKRKCINVILFLSYVSLISFSLVFVAPSLIMKLPLYDGKSVSYMYYNGLLFVVPVSRGYGDGITVFLNRNCGPCWEPGCFQAFVNLALIFFVEQKKSSIFRKKDWVNLCVLVITIITTFSVAGFIILFFILLFNYRFFISKLNISKKYSLLLKVGSFFFVIFVIIFAFNSSVFNRFVSIVSGNYDYTFEDRLDLNKIEYIFVRPNGIINVFGMSFEESEVYFSLFSNSIIYSFVCLGIPFTFCLITQYFKNAKYITTQRLTYLICLFVSFCNEGLFWKCFFVMFAFYDVFNSNVNYYQSVEDLQ